MSIDDWTEVKEEVSTTELDALVQKMTDLRSKYDEAKAVSNAAWEEYKAAQQEVDNLLEKAGKSKYVVEGIGTVSVVEKQTYKMPKDLENKKLVMDYLKEKDSTALMNLLTINAQTFNSTVRGYVEEAAEKGEVLNIPGVDAPTSFREIRFRKERK